MTKPKVFELPYAKITMRDDGICCVDLVDDIMFTSRELSEIIDILEIVSEGKKIPILSLFKPGNSADKSARELSCSPRGMQFTKADAFVIHNITQKIIANFYLKINRPEKPTRFFLDENEAVAWLKSLK